MIGDHQKVPEGLSEEVTFELRMNNGKDPAT